MTTSYFPSIDPVATGRNILRLRKERGLTVRDLQDWFDFSEPRAIYKWQSGQTLPSIDNLYALSVLFGVPMDKIIIGRSIISETEPPIATSGSVSVLWIRSGRSVFNTPTSARLTFSIGTTKKTSHLTMRGFWRLR